MEHNIYIYPGTEDVFSDIAIMLCHAFELKKIRCIINNALNPEKINVIFGANQFISKNKIINLPDNSIIVNMEQLYDKSPWVSDKYIMFLKLYTVWDYNLSNIKYLREKHNIIADKISFGYTPALHNIPANTEDIDVLFYGCMNDRRKKICQELRDKKVNIVFNSNINGALKNNLISRAKIILNIHFHESALLEIPRVSHLLNNKRFVITEDSTDMTEYDDIKDAFVISSYDKLVETTLTYLNNPTQRARIADVGYQKYSKINPQVPIEQNLIPMIYCINLPSRIDRKRRMIDRFSMRGISNYTFVDALNSNAPLLTYYDPTINQKEEASKKNMAAFASHIKVMRKFLETTRNEAIICEDDVLPHVEFINQYNNLRQQFPNDLTLCTFSILS